MNNERIGFVGLGMMGLPMAKNLVEAGYTVTVFDLDAGAIEEAQEFGASPASTGAEVAAQSDIIITMVPDSPHVEAAIAGNGDHCLIRLSNLCTQRRGVGVAQVAKVG